MIHMRGVMVTAVWKTDDMGRIYIVDVDMEKRSQEEIAKDAALP